jgi:hypothetical protein
MSPEDVSPVDDQALEIVDPGLPDGDEEFASPLPPIADTPLEPS